MRTVGRIRPRHVLQRWLPFPTENPTLGPVENWTWRDIGLLCGVITPLLVIDVGILWGGLPWLARQASLPVWVGLAAATGFWATGPAHKPMSGRLAGGGIIALVWLAASPDLAFGGLVFLFAFSAYGGVLLKAMHDLVTGLRWLRRSDWT